MKTKEKKELLEKTEDELHKMVAEARMKLFSYKMDKEQGKLPDLRLLSKVRDDVAIMLTILQGKKKVGGKHA